MQDQLSERQRAEKKYHDDIYKKDDSYEYKYTSAGSVAYNYYNSLIRDVNGMDVLDYGCGTGWMSISIAEGGARVWGIDISDELIKKARSFAKDKGFCDKVTFEEMPGENMTFEENKFDLVTGSAILHHTDLALAIKDINRVLRPGGRAVFIEPMNQNIFLRVWRRLTPWRRSHTERALSVEDLKMIKAAFPEARFNFFILTAIFSAGLMLLAPESKFLIHINSLFTALDRFLLKMLPSLGTSCAIVVMELRKS